MGLFNHLFKNKPPQGDEEMDEGRQTAPPEGAGETQPDPTVFLHPKAYVPRSGAAPVLPGARPAGHGGGRPYERKASQSAPLVAGEIILTLGDVLSRIPTRLLKSGSQDAKRELRFKIGDLSSDIARGRAVVPLSRIAALCPDIFQKEVTEAEDMDVRLPLQKLVEQIGLMRSNPPAPLPKKAPRPTPSEAPTSLAPERVPLVMRTPAGTPREAPQPKAESKPGTPGALPPGAIELKPRVASPPFAPQELSKALQENILKAKSVPLRRVPAESRHGIPAKQEPLSPAAKGGEALEKQSDLAAAKSEKVVPFPAIAAKAEAGLVKADEENSENSAETALEERLRQLLEQKAAGESALNAELMAPSHLVTALAEIALQQSLLKTLEARETHAADVSLAQPANLEASKESVAKSQSLGILRTKVDAGGAAEAAQGAGPVEMELKSLESRRAAEASQEITKAPATLEPLEVSVSGSAAAAAIHVEMPGKVIAPKETETKKAEVRAAEVFEEKREGTPTPEPLEESVPKANAISSFPAAIVHMEFAPKEAKPNKSEPRATEALDAALKDLPRPEPPNRVSEAIMSATPPVEIPHTEIPSKAAESKKPEVRAAEVFEDARQVTAAAALIKGVVSIAESISPPKSEIAQTEIAPKETESRKTEDKVVEAYEAALVVAKPKSPPAAILKADLAAPLAVELAAAETAQKKADSKKLEVSAVEAFEGARTAAATPGVVEESVSNAEPSAPLQAEIAKSELAPNEMEPKSLQASAAAAVEDIPKEFATPKPPEERGSKSETVACFPVEMPRAETPPQQPDLKKPEVSPAGVFEDSGTESPVPALVDASGPQPKPVAPRQAEDTHTEIALQEQESKKPESSAAAVHVQTLKGSVNENIVQSEAAAPLAMEPIHSDIVPDHSAPPRSEASISVARAPEASIPVASAPVASIPVASAAEASIPLASAPEASIPVARAPEASIPVASAPDALHERVKTAAIPRVAEFEPKEAPELAVLAETQTSKLSGQPETPRPIDESAEVSRKDESIAALLVSVAELAEFTPETSADSALQLDEEGLMHGAGRIRLRLPALLKNCPKEIFAGVLPPMRGGLEIELPFAQIEPQLASGVVEISSLRFIAALPPEYMQYFIVREDVKVSIPLEEILRNLPESEREKYAHSAKPTLDAGVEQIRAEAAQPKTSPPSIPPVAAVPHAEEANVVDSAAVKAVSEAMAVMPGSIPSIHEPTGLEIGEKAQKSEHTAPEPQAPAAAVAEPLAPPASAEHSPTLFDAEAEEPLAAADRHVEEKSAESAPAPPPDPEPIQPAPFVLNIPAFRIFAPPPPHLSSSIVASSAPSAPVAWSGHVPFQSLGADEPREEGIEALHSAARPEDGAPKPEAIAKSPAPGLETSPKQGFAAPSDWKATDVAANPENSPSNADAPKDRHLHSPGAPLSAGASLSNEGALAQESEESVTEALNPPLDPGASAGVAPAPDPAAFPLESGKEADVSSAPEANEPERLNIEGEPSTPPLEHTALIRPPMIRPVAVPPPRIFGFTPAVDPQTAASEAERSSAEASSGHAGLEAPSIFPASIPAAEGAASGPAAESQRETMLPETKSPTLEAAPTDRAPDSPEPDFAPKDTATVASQPGRTVPQIAGDSAGEKAPIPVPPKIALSLPRLPVLHVPPAPKSDPEIPGPESVPAPPPLPLARFNQDALQTLFMTDEFLDLAAVCRQVSTLPGIQTCVISRRDENVHAGEMPAGFELSELLAFAPGVRQVAGRLPIGDLKHFTLYAETHSVSFFERHGVCLCVVHRARSFIPGVREKLVTVADELSKL